MKDSMTWEQCIISIRENPKYAMLVEKAYFDKDLLLNVTRFKDSEEYKETLTLFPSRSGHKILDVGSGNGITAVAFAQEGHEVHAIEPDPSNTVGAGAIKLLKQELNLDNLHVYESLAEDIKFESDCFDIVYVRQAMHHAADLDKFILECLRVLKPNGLLLTVRDHVIYDEEDKQWFLDTHPLHQFYGGENAYTREVYREAFAKANGEIIKELKFYDSVINYFPLTEADLAAPEIAYEGFKKKLFSKLSILKLVPFVSSVLWILTGRKKKYRLDERKIPGRVYSYIVTKE